MTGGADFWLKKDSTVDLSVEDGLLVVTPLMGRRARLKKMLSLITLDNLPDEKEPFGKSAGREAW